MKKLSKLLALATSLIVLAFTGCSDLNDNGSVANGVTDNTANEKKYNVSFAAAATGEAYALDSLGISSNTVSRTIVSDSINISTGISFFIWGTDEINPTTNVINPKKVTFVADTDSTTTGTVILDYAASKYYFVLAAVKDADVPGSLTPDNLKNKAVYIGYANVDLRNGDSIKFYISSDGLEGGGGFDLTLKADAAWSAEHLALVGDDAEYTITAGLYDRITDEAISGVDVDDVTNASFVGSGHEYEGTNVTPGAYNFTIKFTKGGNTYEYSDIIIILPNQTVTKTIEVPDIIESAPTPPQAFKVAYIEPKDKLLDEYNLLFEWTDKSNNEKSFQIEYVDVSAQSSSYVNEDMQTAFENWQSVEDDSTKSNYTNYKSAAATAWNTAITGLTAKVIKIGKEFYGNSDEGWVAGSLQKNNTHIVMRLALGKRYIFRITAINDANANDNIEDYAYATYGTDLTWNDTDAYNAANYSASKFATTKATVATPATYGTAVTYEGGDDRSVFEDGKSYYTSNDGEGTLIDPSTAAAGTYYPLVTPAVVSGYADATSLTANLYRLVYHLNAGTYYTAADSQTSDDIVEYKSQGEIDLKCPSNPIKTGTGAVYPQLSSSLGKRWTAWKSGSIAGTNYGTAVTVSEDGVNFTYYDPGDYTGYTNLDLFASYNLSNAAVVAYNDADYDLVDNGTTLDDAIVSVTTTTGVEQVTIHSYKVSSAISNVAFKYNGDIPYTSMKAVIKRGNTVIATDTFTTSKTYTLATKSLPLGTYIVTVYAEYKGRTYSYPITLVIEDPSA